MLSRDYLSWLGFLECKVEPLWFIRPDVDGVFDRHLLPNELKDCIAQDIFWISDFCFSKDLAVHLLEAIAQNQGKKLELVSEYGNSYDCLFSVVVRHSKNVLVFRGELFSFLVVQGVTSCDYLMFPSLGLLIEVASGHVNEDDRLGLLFQDVISYVINSDVLNFSQFDFTGVIACHRRPAHFFYDCLIGMEQCFGQKLKSISYNVDYLAAFPGGDFWDLGDLYPCLHAVKRLRLSETGLNQFSQSHGIGFIKIAVQFEQRSSDLYRMLMRDADLRLYRQLHSFRGINRVHYELELDLVLTLRSRGFFVLWFGISSTKRCLSDQVDLLVALVRLLRDLCGEVCVIVDGWTRALTPLPSDEDFIGKETILLQEIQARLDDQVPIVNAVGLTAPAKAALSLLVDFHVTPCGSASLWPSRFAMAPGVLHSNQNYYSTSIASQVYASGSSLYPMQGVLDFVKKAQNIRPYFIGILPFIAWVKKEFLCLLVDQKNTGDIKRDAMLLRVDEAMYLVSTNIHWMYSFGSRDWDFWASKQSRFVFRINEPKIAGAEVCVRLTLVLDSPEAQDEVVVMCKTSAGQLFSIKRFLVSKYSTQIDIGVHCVDVILSVPYVASRLIVKPRQSEGIVRFDALTIRGDMRKHSLEAFD